ncbi:MAG: secretin N-terminal domain-containing protein [Nautiliaceae bacterium]
MKWIKVLLFLTVILNAREISLNFTDLKIEDFIKMTAKITHKNILVTAPLGGKVNFIAVKPIKESEIYDILLNILSSKGYTLKEDNGFLKVIKQREAIKDAPPLAKDNTINQIETDLITLKNIDARLAFTQVSYLLSRAGRIIINKEKNMLIITDYPKNLNIIKKILKRIDTQNENIVKIYPLKYAQTTKIYPQIREIAVIKFDPKIYKYKIITNTNSNEFIFVGPKNVVNELLKYTRSLDTKPKPLNQQTKVVRLKNSDVSKFVPILNRIVKIKYKKNPPSITADKETNSLIIIATAEQIETINSIINALDIPKMQVYVKAKILEISNSKASQIGNKLGLAAGSASDNGLYTLSANLGGSMLAFNPSELGLSIPDIKEGIALGATFDLLETYGAAKKLSEPSLLCINNTPSTIYVGKTISVKTGKTTSTSTSVSYTRQDIGLTLKIKPRIDSDNKVALNVKTIVEDILPGSPDMTLPTTSKRNITTTTIVNNGQSIIIGGLVKNNKDVTLQKVPLLGDIPLLGALFRHKVENNDKTTLVIVLTPYIVKKSDDLDKLRFTLAKLNELEKKFAQKLIEKIKKKNEND